jgi:hypothetical protein
VEPHYEIEPPKRARAFQSPFKRCAWRKSTREANDKKDSTVNSSKKKKKKKEGELCIPNALETDNTFKVACSVAALLLFFHDMDFKGKTTRGETFEECDKYHQAPLSYMWQNILLKQPAEKLSIALHTILTHQEVRPYALGGFRPFRQNTLLIGTLMDKFRQGNRACIAEPPPTAKQMRSSFTWYHMFLT